MFRLLPVMVLLMQPVAAFGDDNDGREDLYMRSEHSHGEFQGAQQILTEPRDGFYKVSYCGRNYWVRGVTVLWTEREAKAGRRIVIEDDSGDGRVIICDHADQYVKIEDLELADWERDLINKGEDPITTKPSRLRIIRDAFQSFKLSN